MYLLPSFTPHFSVMSFPHEDSSHANSIEEVRMFLETRHSAAYLVFNLSGHPYDASKLNNQVRRGIYRLSSEIRTAVYHSGMYSYWYSYQEQVPMLEVQILFGNAILLFEQYQFKLHYTLYHQAENEGKLCILV